MRERTHSWWGDDDDDGLANYKLTAQQAKYDRVSIVCVCVRALRLIG